MLFHGPGASLFLYGELALSLFADDANWAIAFEKSGYANRAFEIELALDFFGRDLRNLKPGGRYNEFAYNSQYFTLVAADAVDEVSQDFEEFSPSAARVKVRVRYVGLPPRNEGYAKCIPTLFTRDYPELVTFADLARYPTFVYEDLCCTTPDDLRTCLPLTCRSLCTQTSGTTASTTTTPPTAPPTTTGPAPTRPSRLSPRFWSRVTRSATAQPSRQQTTGATGRKQGRCNRAPTDHTPE